MIRRILSLFAFACAALYGVMALSWAAMNLGHVPHYGDSIGYLRIAKTLEFDSYWSIAYPIFLAAADWLLGEPSILTPSQDWPKTVSSNFIGLQLLQIAISLLALVYFVHVFGGHLKRRALVFVALVSALALDPLVLHFNMSVMADGLALSSSMVFCASIADLYTRRRAHWPTMIAFFVSFLMTAGLRIEEKYLICLATVLVTVALWRLFDHGNWQRGLNRTSIVLGGLAIGAFVSIVLVKQGYSHNGDGQWSRTETVLHQRIIYPNLVSIHDRLPDWISVRIDPANARIFDQHYHNGRDIINHLTHGNAKERRRMIQAMAAIAWRERWERIVGNALRGAVENVFATISFYGRLTTWAVCRECFHKIFHYEIFNSDGTGWTYTRFEMYHPFLSRAYIGLSGCLFLMASVLAFLRLREFRDPWSGRTDRYRGMVVFHAPLGIFVILNAGLFAAAGDLVHIRYTILAHVAFLMVVFRGALEWRDPAESTRQPIRPPST